MCYNQNVSLASFIVGTLVAIFLIKRKKPFDATFGFLIFFYSIIQLSEYLMWKSLEDGLDTELNLKATKLAYYSLWSNLLGLGIGIWKDTGNKVPMFVGTLAMIIARIVQPTFTISRPTKESLGHLVWGFDSNYYILVFILCTLSFIYKTDLKHTWIAFPFFIGGLLISKFKYKGTASYWCWISAALSFVILVFK